MKRIEAFIQPHRLSAVVQALHALPSFPGFTSWDAQGQGHGRGAGGHYVYEADEGFLMHRRKALVIFCEDGQASGILQAIARAAHTGNKGDGLVAVTDVASFRRIRVARSQP